MNIPKGYVKFSAFVIISGIIASVVFILIIQAIGKQADVTAVISNLVFCLVNVLAGVLIVISGLDKSNSVFFSRLLGSLFVRILIMAAYVALGLAVFKFEEINFVMSLFVFYFLFLVLEMLYIFPNKEKLKGSNN
ncbi:MAG: hypothetical protein KC684_10625 [Candidatus Omnitrophica bacterium]|nr:hypothetical protein [Candidatus Omnitrophota bacterium]